MTDAMALHHATAELVANSVRHAYRDADLDARPVSVHASVTDAGRVVVEVADQGRWRETDEAEHQPLTGGRGLSLARLLTEELHVERRPIGTSVRLSFAPVRPVSLFTTVPTRRADKQTADFDMVEQPDGLAVTGPLDLGQAERMRFALARATRGGTRGTVVDLTDASHLDSTAVQVLLDAAEGLPGERQPARPRGRIGDPGSADPRDRGAHLSHRRGLRLSERPALGGAEEFAARSRANSSAVSWSHAPTWPGRPTPS